MARPDGIREVRLQVSRRIMGLRELLNGRRSRGNVIAFGILISLTRLTRVSVVYILSTRALFIEM